MNLPIKEIAHIGLEIIIITGVTFWLHRKSSKLEERVKILEDHIQQLESTLGQAIQMLQHQSSLLSNLGVLGGSGNSEPSQRNDTKMAFKSNPKAKYPKNTRRDSAPRGQNNFGGAKTFSMATGKSAKKVPKKVDLDELLKEELSELQNEGQGDEESIEIPYENEENLEDQEHDTSPNIVKNNTTPNNKYLSKSERSKKK